MRNRVVAASLVALIFMFMAAGAFADEITREFGRKSEISINTISGNCRIERGTSDKIIVKVLSDYDPEDAFEPIFKERDDVLILSEKIEDSSRGDILWVLTIPDSININFSSASGGLEISAVSGKFYGRTASGDYNLANCSGIFDLNTASGGYRISDCRGDFDINSASGDCRLTDCQGVFEVSSASGNVRARGIILDDDSKFSSASGSADVQLGKSPAYDLNIGSASGKASLDYMGNPMTGYIEMTAKRRGGRIVSDIKFDKEEFFDNSGQKYVRKSVTLKDNQPSVSVGTASGTAELRK